MPATVHDAWKAWRAHPSETTEVAYRTQAASARSGPVPNAGEIVDDRFLLEQPLGDGAIATTWRATDLATDRPAAIKFLHTRFLHHPEVVERFHEAIRRQAEVAERGITPVLAAGGAWCGFRWAALALAPMPLLVGLRSPAPPERRQLLLDVTQALVDAHTSGLAHGRLSPGNVVLDDAGAAGLTDFGLFPPRAGEGPFAPPEASDPDWRPTPAGDRYALAMLALWVYRDGALPFWAGRSPERVLAETALPDELRGPIEASLALEPEQRPADLADWVRALRGDADTTRALAQRAMAAHRPETALDHYRHLLAVTGGDPDVRVDLARALAASGREQQAVDQLYAAIRAPRLQRFEEALHDVRTLVERVGEVVPLIDALEARAREPNAPRDVLLLEAARLRARSHHGDPEPAWRAAFAAHTRREQASVSLWALVELAALRGDGAAFVTWGRELCPQQDDAADLEYRMGKVFLDTLHDPQSALLWLERAHTSGHPAADLQPTLERIRTERGDWPQVIALLRHRADLEPAERADLLRRAARVARYAAADPELAAKLYAQLLKDRRDDVEARWYLADRARSAGDPVAEREHLRQLDPESLDDSLPAETRTHATLRLAQLMREDGDLAAATHLTRAALTEAPHHIGALWLDACLARERGELAAGAAALEALSHLLEAGSDGWCDALCGRAEIALRQGDTTAAWQLAQRVVAVCPDDPVAAWLVARCALTPGVDEAWMAATPTTFTPQEALARCLDGLLQPDAIEAWFEGDPLCRPLGACTHLERVARVVEALLARGWVDDDGLGRLEALDPRRADHVAIVRRLWSGLAPDTSVPVSRTYLWCHQDASRPEFSPSVYRRVVGPPRARSPYSQPALVEPFDVSRWLVADPALPDPVAPAVPALPLPDAPVSLRLVVHAGTPRRWSVDLDADGVRSVGDGPDDTLRVDGLAPGRARVHRVGPSVYLVSDAADIRTGHRTVAELRLLPGVTADIDGVGFAVVAAADDVLAPVDLSDEGDEHTSILPIEVEPEPVGLFTSDSRDDYLIALGATLTLEDHQLVTEPDGWRLIAPDGASTFLVVGDAFVVGGQRYTLRRIAALTPAPAPRLEIVDDRVPTLVIHDGTLLGRVIPLIAARTTLGRGRDADIRVGSDTRISRLHAVIELRPERVVVLTDGGSSNGTFVDGGQILDEHVLMPGEIIEIGDTSIEFRLGSAPNAGPAPVDEREDPSPTVHVAPSSGPRTGPPRIALSDGRQRLSVVNRALAPLLRALADGGTPAADALQELLDAAPRRYSRVFDGVPAKGTGLPVLPVLHNLASLQEWEQKSLLASAALDLIDRAIGRCAETIDAETLAPVLQEVNATNYRKHLTLT